jgi:hypothetical protein
MTADGAAAGLAEYEQLKEEQRTRVGFRDNLLYATLASYSLIVAATLQGGTRQLFLLALISPAALVLGWTYLVNDQKISAIGDYLRSHLAPRLGAVDGIHGVLGWEWAHRQDSRRSERKRLQASVDIGVFSLAPTSANLVFWIYGDGPLLAVLASVLGTLCTTGLAYQILINVDSRP